MSLREQYDRLVLNLSSPGEWLKNKYRGERWYLACDMCHKEKPLRRLWLAGGSTFCRGCGKKYVSYELARFNWEQYYRENKGV